MRSCFKYLFYFILLIPGINATGLAQGTGVIARLDSTAIPIGQQTMLRLFAHIPVGEKIVFPEIRDSIAPGLMVVQPGKTDTIQDKDSPDMHTIRRTYILTSFDAGTYTVPPLAFLAGKDSLRTEALTLQVTSVKVDTTKAIYDIKQPMSVSYSVWDWLRDNWLWIVLVLLAAGILVVIIRYLKKRPARAPVAEDIKPALPPHITALNKLYELRDKKLWQADLIKQYHSELSDIVREYIEKRYGVKTQEKTSAEILSGLKRLNLRQDEWNYLQQLFGLADLVKFAKERPLPADNELSMDNAVAFINSAKNPDDTAAGETKEGGGTHELV